MAGSIDMENTGIPMSQTRESTVQSGGNAGGIDMFGGAGVTLSHAPVSSVQKGGSGGGIEMVGEQNLLDKTPNSPYGAMYPSDKGEA